jgi:hypothetical protein
MNESTHYQVEPDGSNDAGVCADCGNRTQVIWGYIYESGEPRAVYYARWTPAHVDRGVQLLVSFGEWGEGADPSTRRAVGLECKMGFEVPSFMVIDAATLPWAGDVLGRTMTRSEALASDAAEEAFGLVNALWEQEPQLRQFLLGE